MLDAQERPAFPVYGNWTPKEMFDRLCEHFEKNFIRRLFQTTLFHTSWFIPITFLVIFTLISKLPELNFIHFTSSNSDWKSVVNFLENGNDWFMYFCGVTPLSRRH